MPLLILGLPVMDIIQVVPVRIKKKLPLPGPDKEHFHHQIAKLGFSQYEVVALIYVLQALLLVGAYLLRHQSDYLVFALFVAFAAMVLGILYAANVSGWKVRPINATKGRNNRNDFFRRLGVLHPYTGTFFGAFLAVFFAFAALVSSSLPPVLIYLALLLASIVFLAKLLWRQKWAKGVGRLVSYSATILLVWGMTQSVASEQLNQFVDITLALIAVLLLLAMRITRRVYFGLTTEDLLVALFIVTLDSSALLEFGHGSTAISAPFRICILLYACEYLLARGDRAIESLTLASAFALLLTGINL